MASIPRLILLAAAGWLLVWEAHALGLSALPTGPATWIHLVVMAAGAGLCLARAAADRRERTAWGLIGLGLCSWIAGETYFTLVLWDDASPPIPSPADAGFLLMPPLVFTGIVLLLRSRMVGLSRTLWVDGITSALAVGAVGAAVVVQIVLDSVGGSALAVATNLAYPVSDLVLSGLIIGAVAACGWRIDRTFALLITGVLSFWLSDTLYLVLAAKGAWTSGGVWDVGWWAAAVFFAAAAWQPRVERAVLVRPRTTAVIVAPIAFALVGLGVLVAGSIGNLNALAIGLAAASLTAVMVRLVLTFRENLAMLAASRVEARTDALTGLANRRALAADVEAALADGGRAVLVLFDLDGFKQYNDTFGHPAGDALLQRLGAGLAERLGERGTAYRMGGDEFCALLSPPDEVLLAAASNALSAHGEGFSIGSSWGSVLLPEEATDVAQALRIADQRLYAHKRRGRPTARSETKEVMLRILAERDPDLEHHVADVADLAESVARELGLDRESSEHVRLAAELHDVGKVAIPDAILDKAGPLDPDEWRFMHRHTIIGERIIGTSAGLAPVAQMVRSSHERWDGRGYPDRLAGEDIPLGARIVAVCDAFDAMTKNRAYRAGMSEEAAITELRRCAGGQFDPRVVAAFEAAVRSRVRVRAA